MMPNKKNPDPAELVRGRSARVIGALTAMLALLKGLPLAYQRDLQEDKPRAVRRGRHAGRARWASWPGLVETLVVDRHRMRAAAEEGYTTATALADALVRRGVPFRAAHHIVGGLVARRGGRGHRDAGRAPGRGVPRGARTARTTRSRGELAKERGIAASLRAAATVEGSLASADVIGGTAPDRVAAALAAAKERLGA